MLKKVELSLILANGNKPDIPLLKKGIAVFTIDGSLNSKNGEFKTKVHPFQNNKSANGCYRAPSEPSCYLII
jgi:hypothetical protein